MENVKEMYEKPEVTDFGTLQELTAICNSAGTGDSSFKDSAHTTQVGNLGSIGFCISS